MKVFSVILPFTVSYYIFLMGLDIMMLASGEPLRTACNREGKFIPGESGYSLSVNILSTQQVPKQIDCAFSCLHHELCVSFNFEHDTTAATHTCELLDKTKSDEPSSYITRTGFMYYESTDMNLCLENSCENGGTCEMHCDGGNYTCLCAAPYSGRQCKLNTHVYSSCQEVDALQANTAPGDGFLIALGAKVLKVFCDKGWTLIARFSNADEKNWMLDTAEFWYTKATPYGGDGVFQPDPNEDMLSEAFWLVTGDEFRITKSDDPSHVTLLETKNCMNGHTFRQKIKSRGTYTGSKVWASNSCQGSCTALYGGAYQTVSGFAQSECDGEIQRQNKIGFFCDWSSGDGAVMMIGGGGTNCRRADHGIGITGANAASFVDNYETDFGDDTSRSTQYSLNLWVR